MNYSRIGLGFSGAVVVLAALQAVPARAQDGLDACGNIHVEAQAECVVVPPSAMCEAMCTPITVRAACAAQLAAECRASCDELPSVDCSAMCQADCSADCEVDPGKFDCAAECRADCGGSCQANCQGDSDGASCMARCEGACGASCDSHCDVELPEVDCDAKCEASCEGKCEVDTNIDCQADCQAELEAECMVDVQGGCEASCDTEEGALFCDGQYVDYGDNLDQCVAALQAALDIEVEGYAHGMSSCDNGHCEASGEAGVNSDCSVAAPGAAARGAWGLSGLALALVAWRARRRRNQRG